MLFVGIGAAVDSGKSLSSLSSMEVVSKELSGSALGIVLATGQVGEYTANNLKAGHELEYYKLEYYSTQHQNNFQRPCHFYSWTLNCRMAIQSNGGGCWLEQSISVSWNFVYLDNWPKWLPDGNIQ